MPLYKAQDAPEVYYRPEEGGALQHIPSPEAFKAGGFKWEDIIEGTPGMMEAWKSRWGVGDPWSVTDLTQGEAAGGINLMSQKPFEMGTSTDRIAAIEQSYQQYLDFQMKQAEAEAKERAELMKEQRTLGQKLKEGIFGGPSIAELQRQQLEKAGVPGMIQQQQAMITEIGTLRQRLDDLNAQEREQVAANEQRAVSTRVIGREEARIKETFSRQRAALSAELSSKAAILQAQRGLLSDARSFAEQAVRALTYDQQQKVAGLQYFFENNQKLISSLDKSVQNRLKDVMGIAQTELTRLRAEKEDILTLMIQYPEAGITPDMSIEEAAQMVQSMPQEEVPEKYGFRTIGRQLYRTSPRGTVELVAEAPYATPRAPAAPGRAEVPEAPSVPTEGGTVEEPAPELKSMAERFITAESEEEQEKYLPKSSKQQAAFWSEVDYLQAQQQQDVWSLLLDDISKGMSFRDAMSFYPEYSPEEIKKAYHEIGLSPYIPPNLGL
jgi:hypothetical protein